MADPELKFQVERLALTPEKKTCYNRHFVGALNSLELIRSNLDLWRNIVKFAIFREFVEIAALLVPFSPAHHAFALTSTFGEISSNLPNSLLYFYPNCYGEISSNLPFSLLRAFLDISGQSGVFWGFLLRATWITSWRLRDEMFCSSARCFETK